MLVAVDSKMQKEIALAQIQHPGQFKRCSFVQVDKRIGRRNIHIAGSRFMEWRPDWQSGHSAVHSALYWVRNEGKQERIIVHLVGMDMYSFPGEAKKINNVYVGTQNYPSTVDSPVWNDTFGKAWARMFNFNPEIEFVYRIPMTPWNAPPGWDAKNLTCSRADYPWQSDDSAT
jgi:hypothetical protein